MPKITLKSLQCILNDEVDKDEVFLKLKGKKIWPSGKLYKQINSGEKIEINKSFDHEEGEMVLELWDFDFLSKNDKFGEFRAKIDSEKGGFVTGLKLTREGSTASYMLEWECR